MVPAYEGCGSWESGRMRHIGIHQYSVEGAVLCYSEIMHRAQGRLGEHQHPAVTMAGLAMADTITEWDECDNDSLRARSAAVIERLASAGADFFLCPDNTAHIALEAPGPDFALPGLHIGEVVADEAARRGFTRVGVLGTNWTMQGPVYPRALGARSIGWAVPEAAVRSELHRIIMDELCLGRFEEPSIRFYQQAIEALAADGCDSVALVCTEIPLIISDGNSALPTLDSTRLLAQAALDVALGERPLPTWRGGAVQG
ncbi:MAG: amino acid racemase [Sphingomicrobium sp.]